MTDEKTPARSEPSPDQNKWRLFKEISRQGKEEKERVLRFFNTGNAGGAVATLALIGTIVGQEKPIPKILVYILLIFVVGLAAIAASRLFNLYGHILAFGRATRDEDPLPEKINSRDAAIGFTLTVAAGLCLLLGVGIGFFELWQLSGPVPPAPGGAP